MPSPKFVVSSRATKGGPTQQVTIPAAIARKLPQGISIRWEVAVVKGGLFFKYLGPNAEIPVEDDIALDFVPASDLKSKPKEKPAAEVATDKVETPAEPEAVAEPVADEASTEEEFAAVAEEEAVEDEAPF